MLRIVYILSLVILGVLLAVTVFSPVVTRSKYSEVQREQLLQTKDEHIIQFSIINHEGCDQSYTITVVVDGKRYSEDVLIGNGKKFAYIHHIRRHLMTEGKVSFTICKKGEGTPIEQIIYYLRPD